MTLPKSKEHIINLGLVDYTPEPRHDDTYATYLERHGLTGRGFSINELVKRWSYRFREPPVDLWHRMAPTLALANELRLWMREGETRGERARGLRVAAAYRPIGGARLSQHKRNAALDLDLLPGDYHLTTAYYETAVRFWCEYGRDTKMGLGLYCRPGREGGIRVHIDTGYRCRTWQIAGKSHRPYWRGNKRVPLAVHLADRMGLVPPSDEVA